MRMRQSGLVNAAVQSALFGLMATVTGDIAHAQTAPASPGDSSAANAEGLQEVLVTARFRQQNLQDTPLAITAVNAASGHRGAQ